MSHSSLLRKSVILSVVLLVCVGLASCEQTFPSNSASPTPQVSASSASSMPRLIPSTCPMTLPAQYVQGKNIECSYLVVKEDRADPNSPDLLLAVARLKSSDPHPASDPLIMLQGGPGGALLSQFDFFASAGSVNKETGKRDIILMDQRGTGYSSPPMKCDEAYAVQFAQLEERLSTTAALKQQDEAVKECRTRLSDQLHINLNAYTSLTNANDVHDLITALNVPQADIYGVSYGTRLALEVMRSFPQHVRSVILDSTVTPQTNPNQDVSDPIVRVYRTLFDDCAAEPDCVKAHPQLEQRFWSFVAKTQKEPVIMQVQDPNTQHTYQNAVMTGFMFAQTFWNMFYVTSLIPDIPKLMEQVMQGDNGAYAKVYGALAFDQSVNFGMYNSVECNENENRSSQARIEQNTQKLDPSVRQDYALNLADSALTQCQIWNVKPEAAKLEQPVQSTIPTLIMEGAYDPITPPSNGMEAAKTLSKSYQILVPSTGHGVFLSSQACPVQVGEAFLQKPEEAPDTGCLQQMPARPAFI